MIALPYTLTMQDSLDLADEISEIVINILTAEVNREITPEQTQELKDEVLNGDS